MSEDERFRFPLFLHFTTSNSKNKSPELENRAASCPIIFIWSGWACAEIPINANAMKFLREHLGKAVHPHQFQHQPHDRVLREEERKRDAFARVCFYVLANSVRAGLINVSWAPY